MKGVFIVIFVNFIGMVIDVEELIKIGEYCKFKGGFLIVDEIYLDLLFLVDFDVCNDLFVF